MGQNGIRHPIACLLISLLLAACQPASPTAPPVQSNLLLPGTPVEQTLTGTAQTHRWLFNGQAGDTLHLHFAPDSTLPTLRITTPSRESLYAQPGESYALPLQDVPLPLPATGTYEITVTLPYDGTATYILQVDLQSVELLTPTPDERTLDVGATPPSAPTLSTARGPQTTPEGTPTPARVGAGARLQDHRMIRGEISDPGASEHYTLVGRAGETITIGALTVPGSMVDPLLTLYTPAGDILAQVDSSYGTTDAIASGIVLPTTGAYVVFVQDASGQHTGAYHLSFGYGFSMTQIAQPALLPDAATPGVIEQPAARDIWPVELGLGDIISAAAVIDADGTLDPVLSLLAPDGTILYSDDNSGGGVNAALRQVIAPQTGRFYLAVSPASGQSFGAYTLIWRYDAQAPTPTPKR